MMFNKLQYILLLTGFLCTACEDLDIDYVYPEAPTYLTKAESAFEAARARNYAEEYKRYLQRSYGVGYGYNAFGAYADYNAIRDVIIDIDSLIYYETLDMAQIITDDRTPETYQTVTEGEDSEKMLKALSVQAGLSSDLKFFQAEVKGSYASSDLRSNYYSFCSVYTGLTLASRHIDPLSLSVMCRRHPTILTPGFRQIIAEIDSCMVGSVINLEKAFRLIDLMYEVYGTHLVYHAKLGGRLTFLNTFERSSLDSRTSMSASARANLLNICGFSTSYQEEVTYQQHSTKSKTRITACGGQETILSRMLFADNVGKLDDPIAQGVIRDWYSSVKIDFDNPENSNVELIDMQLFPMDDFIIDLGYEAVSALVAQKTGKQMEYEDGLFPRVYNKINTSIPTQQLKMASTSQILTLNSGHEVIGELDYECIYGKEYVTLYPAIDGTLCHEGIARSYGGDSLWLINWQDTAVYVTPIRNDRPIPYLYYTHGKIDTAPEEDESYNTDMTTLHIDTLRAYMWASASKASIKVGPYTFIQGSYATLDTASWSNFSSVIKDLPNGCREVLLEDMEKILELTRIHYNRCPEMLAHKNWLLRDDEGRASPTCYTIGEDLTLRRETTLKFGFVPCMRVESFRYP